MQRLLKVLEMVFNKLCGNSVFMFTCLYSMVFIRILKRIYY